MVRGHELSPRERVRLALDHQITDRPPISIGFGANPPVLRELKDHLGLRNEREAWDWLMGFSDIRKPSLQYVGPKLRRFADGSWEDCWGVHRKPTWYGAGYYDEIVYYPLDSITDISQLEDHHWPSVEWWDVSDLRDRIEAIRKQGNYAIQVCNGNIFESAWYMRGFEKMLEDLILNPELAHAIFTKVTDFFIGFIGKVLEAADGDVDLVMTADDIGGQNGLLMSLDMWEEFLKPYHAKLNKMIHEFGVKILYHSDGAVMDAVPGLIDMGIDILEALQFDAEDMDPHLLKELYGDRLCFHGGISVQSTLPFGSVDEVKQEVEDRIRVLGRNGGYIVAPSHTIQAGTPAENVVAMFETAKDFSW